MTDFGPIIQELFLGFLILWRFFGWFLILANIFLGWWQALAFGQAGLLLELEEHSLLDHVGALQILDLLIFVLFGIFP